MCYTLDFRCHERLCDDVLIHYPHVKSLNACGRNDVTNVNHMTNLQFLDASYSGIGDNGIRCINVDGLRMSGNVKITDVSHMTNLRKLIAERECGMTDDTIKSLNLIELVVSNNPNITTVNHMTTLQVLDISNSGIG